MDKKSTAPGVVLCGPQDDCEHIYHILSTGSSRNILKEELGELDVNDQVKEATIKWILEVFESSVAVSLPGLPGSSTDCPIANTLKAGVFKGLAL